MIDKETLKAAFKETYETIIFVVVAVILIRFCIAELRWIPSGSMIPTLVENDRIVVEKLTKFPNLLTNKRFESLPKRGDIMIFYPPSTVLKSNFGAIFCRLTGFFCKDIAYIKRVVALPGEKFEIKRDKTTGASHVYINDKRLEENYIKSEFDYPICTEEMFCGPFIIPENHYFMMGDNRGNSIDSRYWGPLPKERFIGRAVFIFWPIKNIGVLK